MTFFDTEIMKQSDLGKGPARYLTISTEQTRMPLMIVQHKEESSLLVRILLLSVPNLSNQMTAYRRTKHIGIDTDAKKILTSLYKLFSRAPQKGFSVPEEFASSTMML